MSQTSALLVIDVQRVYMEPEPMMTSDGDDLIAKCNRLSGKARSAGVPVVFVRHVSDDQPDDPDLVGIHPRLERDPSDPIVEKHFGSAFFKTDLEGLLARIGAKTLYICGLATFGCVNATVMCAICKDYDVRVVRDAHGTSGLGEFAPAQIIDDFNATWERAGATLVLESEAEF